MQTTMCRYLDPTNDVAFKKLFGTEDHKPLLLSFLNAILGLEGSKKIKVVQFLPQEQIPRTVDSKRTILDIKCTDQDGHQYIVEMQNRKVPDFVKRTQYYLAHSYVSQALKSSNHIDLKPVILLAIVNHELFTNKDQVISYHKTLDTNTYENDLQDHSYCFVELPKFHKSENELETLQDKWIYFFKEWNHTDSIPKNVYEEEIKEAYHSMEQFNWNPGELDAYVKANIALTSEYAARKQEREEGKEEGLKEGKEEGLKEGKEEGVFLEKQRIAIAMLNAKTLIDEISLITGLSPDQIRKLKK
jgi:predicted transposase/invertase (TIGR01784 family)